MIGSLLSGRYRFGRSLGAGSTGEVFEGYDESSGRPVAIKVVHEGLAGDENFRVRFRWEVRDAGRLSHPNVVALLASGEQAERPFLVMELLEGRTLAEELAAARQLDPGRAVEIARAALAGLGAVHADGLVHHDVKPANLMLTAAGGVKVLDVGIASAAWAGPSGATTANAMLARVTTAAYLSPEQVRGSQVDRRSDLYSLGCCLYEMLTGRPPFGETTPIVVARRHLLETPRPPSVYAPGVSPELEEVVVRAMSRDPDGRFASAFEMERALARAAPVPQEPSAGTDAGGVRSRGRDAGIGSADGSLDGPAWLRLGLASALTFALGLATFVAR